MPFHNDDRPSLHVYPTGDRGWCCFSCAGGAERSTTWRATSGGSRPVVATSWRYGNASGVPKAELSPAYGSKTVAQSFLMLITVHAFASARSSAALRRWCSRTRGRRRHGARAAGGRACPYAG